MQERLFTMKMDETVHQQLRTIAFRERQSMAEIVRQAIGELLKRYENAAK